MGIDVLDAQRLWFDPLHIEIPAKTTDEPGSLVIDLIEGKHWSAVITPRGTGLRIISVRRSRKEEVELDESQGV
ncbi:BrnT family toxin [Halomonas litopenaei]|uniref:BrnT family toxin n=1 Tax=Halomonas litopenaei TaxID=2109328 RepID=UPI003FA06FDA